MNDDEERAALRGQAIGAKYAVELINATTDFMMAPSDSPEEQLYEGVLLEKIADVANMPAAVIGNVLMTFTTIIRACTDGDDVQAWFEQHAHNIRGAME